MVISRVQKIIPALLFFHLPIYKICYFFTQISTGRASPPPSRVSSAFSNRVTTVGAALPPLVGKAKPPINVVGDVNGRVAIMVDDMIDDVKSFIDAAHILKERGAYKIYVLATHGILSADAPRLIEESPIDEVSDCDLARLTRGPRLLSYFSLVLTVFE